MCQLVQNECIIDYEVVLSGPFNTIGRVFVGDERGEWTKCDEQLRYMYVLDRNIYIYIYTCTCHHVYIKLGGALDKLCVFPADES